MDALRGRWRTESAAAAPGARDAPVEDIGSDLLRRWREPHRRYHDATRLGEVLSAVDTLCTAEAINDADRAVAALGTWFHDAVYAVEPAAGNEARSAALAAGSSGGSGSPAS